MVLIDHGRVMFDGPLAEIVERFSGNKIIEAKFATPTVADFSMLGNVLEQKPDILRVETPRAKVAEVCRALFDKAVLADLTVTEPPIEEIIRQVFGQETRQ